MGIAVGSSFVAIERDWTTFKNVLNGTEKTLLLQSEYVAPIRTNFAVDGNVVYTSTIYDTGSEPAGWSAGQITANTAAQTDYTTNFAPTVNKQVSVRGTVKHYNGTAVAGGATVTFTPTSASVIVHNTDTVGTNNLLVSFDGGTTFKTLTKGIAISFNATLASVSIKSSAGSVPYEILVVS